MMHGIIVFCYIMALNYGIHIERALRKKRRTSRIEMYLGMKIIMED